MSQVDPENLAVGVPKVAGSTDWEAFSVVNTSGISARLKNQILNTIVSIALKFVNCTYLIASVENSVTHMPPWFALNCPKDLSDGSRMMHPVFPSSESPQFSMETVPVISVDCTTLHSPPPPVNICISLRYRSWTVPRRTVSVQCHLVVCRLVDILQNVDFTTFGPRVARCPVSGPAVVLLVRWKN